MLAVTLACAGIGGLAFATSRDAWRQVHRNDPLPPRPKAVPRAGGRRSGGAGARAQRRGEVLHQDATVTLSDERATVSVDDVFASLDSELVGLFPVKNKVEQIASLLLVDRVRQKFGLSAPRPNLHMCFTGEPGTGKTTVPLRMADSVRNELERARLRHAHRLAADPQLSRSRDDLMRLEPVDILTSPVLSLSAIEE